MHGWPVFGYRRISGRNNHLADELEVELKEVDLPNGHTFIPLIFILKWLITVAKKGLVRVWVRVGWLSLVEVLILDLSWKWISFLLLFPLIEWHNCCKNPGCKCTTCESKNYYLGQWGEENCSRWNGSPSGNTLNY